MRNRWTQVGFVFAVLLLATTAAAQPAGEENSGPRAETPLPDVDDAAVWRFEADCTLFRPADVQGYDIQCPGATFLDAQHADFFIPGDHFQSKLKSWDSAPNTAVTTSPGPAGLFGPPARVYNYTGVGGLLHAYLECTYIHGVNVFPAGSTILLSSNAACAVTPDPIRSRIDRSP